MGGGSRLDTHDRVILEALVILAVTVVLLAIAAEASGRRVPRSPVWILRLTLDTMKPVRRRLVILGCLAAVLFLQAGIVQTLADPPTELGDSGRAVLVAELVVAAGWAVILAGLRGRRPGR